MIQSRATTFYREHGTLRVSPPRLTPPERRPRARDSSLATRLSVGTLPFLPMPFRPKQPL